jgi:hypothetical protein
MELKDLQDTIELKIYSEDTMELKDLQDTMDFKELKDFQDTIELKDIKDTSVIPDIGIDIPSLDFLNKELSNTNLIDKSVNIYNILINLLEKLQAINSKGFINDTNLYNYDLIKEVIPYIIEDSGLKPKSKVVIMGKITMELGTAMELYKLSYNLLNLKLYLVSEYIIKDLEEFFKSKEEKVDIDILHDFKNIAIILNKNLDPSISILFNKRGMSIIQNIYTGFDTEYQNINSQSNKLLSVQMAITNKTLLKLPIKKDFDFESYNISTNSFYKRERENKDPKG